MQFVRGTIRKVSATAYPEPDDIWDVMYWLEIFGTSQTIRVFDYACISLDLKLKKGDTLACVLRPLLVGPIFLDAMVEPAMDRAYPYWQGQIVSTDWRAPQTGLRRTMPDLYERRTFSAEPDTASVYDSWVLVETHVGHLIMSLPELQDELQQTPRVGQTLFWQDTRYDLYAIV